MSTFLIFIQSDQKAYHSGCLNHIQANSLTHSHSVHGYDLEWTMNADVEDEQRKIKIIHSTQF